MAEQPKVTESSTSIPSLLKRLGPLIVLVIVIAAIYLSGGLEYLTIENLAANRDKLKAYIADNLLLSLAIYTGIYLIAVAASIPGGIFLTLTGGFLFGWLFGGLATVVGATLGATIIFLIAKTALGEPLAAKAGPKLNALREGFQEDALSYLFFLRLVPLFPFWLVNIAPGLLGVKLSTFVFATFFGIIPGTFAFSFAGVGLDSVLDAQQQAFNDCKANLAPGSTDTCTFSLDPNSLVTKEIVFAIAALGIVALIPVVLKRFKKSTSPV